MTTPKPHGSPSTRAFDSTSPHPLGSTQSQASGSSSPQPLNETSFGSAFLNTINERIPLSSSRFWAVHFGLEHARLGVQSVFCFAQLMDELATARPEVIADKSIWWHEEIERMRNKQPRHPVCCALLYYLENSALRDTLDNDAIITTLHTHLHGALMTQQQFVIDTHEAWTQYAELRIGSLHALLELVHGQNNAQAQSFGNWSAQMHYFAVARAPHQFKDARWLKPEAKSWLDTDSQTLPDALNEHQLSRSTLGNPSSEIVLHHELAWWEKPAKDSTPFYSNNSVGLLGMLASWRVARATCANFYVTP